MIMDGTAGEVITQLKIDSDDFVFKQYDGTEVILCREIMVILM